MKTSAIIERRLQSHRLSAPAPTVAAAAAHMLATQAQEFWGGRWALAVRTKGDPSVRDVDAAFDRGEIVRSWTMRGTIHVASARDLGWLLSVTGERQYRSAAAVHRREGIDAEQLARAGTLACAALRGRNLLTRKELFDLWEAGGVPTAGQRGYHVLVALSVRAVLCQGPVVPRPGGPTREQYIVRTDEWVQDAAAPAEPAAEMFARYIASHGPAGARDFAWWSGLPLGIARGAAAAASDRLCIVADEGDPQYVLAAPAPRRDGAAHPVLALPPFEEYYLSYADRTVPCAPEFLARIGPGSNGIVRPILVAHGRIFGVWTHSIAIGRHGDAPAPELLAPDAAADADIAAALHRYRDFVTT